VSNYTKLILDNKHCGIEVPAPVHRKALHDRRKKNNMLVTKLWRAYFILPYLFYYYGDTKYQHPSIQTTFKSGNSAQATLYQRCCKQALIWSNFYQLVGHLMEGRSTISKRGHNLVGKIWNWIIIFIITAIYNLPNHLRADSVFWRACSTTPIWQRIITLLGLIFSASP